MSLSGNALVTGAGSGIGQALALAYAEAGCAAVVLADIIAEGLAKTAEMIKETHPNTKTLEIVADVAVEKAVENLFSQISKELGELHYATNVAGITCKNRTKTADYQLEEYDRINSVNARGVLLCTQAEIRMMRSQPLSVTSETINVRRAQRGSIVNIASVTSIGALQNIMPYTTSKHAVMGITKSAAIDHARDGIRVNAVCPGFVETPMLKLRMEQLGHKSQTTFQGQEGIPMARMALADEVADACIFLSSSRSSYMNGSALVMDGGKLATFQYTPPHE